MKLVIYAVNGSDTFHYLNRHDQWKIDETPSAAAGQFDLVTFIRAVDGAPSHSLSADELTSEAPQSNL